ncbi:MAG: response regulator [Candidatus Omnitrophota bacterium]
MKKILIVDDKDEIRSLISEELTDSGYETILASGGREALDFLEKTNFAVDLVLLDIKMPDINGLDVLKFIKEKKRELPVILLSAYHTYKQDFSSWAAEDYVIKASDFTELKKKISKYI